MSILLMIIGYLLGSIPFALLVGKIGYGIDIREHGSGNLGGTNTFRVLGVKAGLIVTIADILKGTLAASLPVLFHVDIHPLITGMFAVFGHTYPVFAQFRGGKAVATSGGVLLFYSPVLFMTMLAVFFLILYISKYVSLSSMLTGMYATVYAFIWTDDIPLRIVVTLLTLFVFYRHRANIKRILNKTEPKVKWL
ncbi:glycerol-3-phosphate 1-O-acyltransferase PlsY [Anoxybacillus ayderensis]|uniref:glycerol-3-phosphate 1-O-acyltransferase PlsY n=1 Tax=Anoxybacillus ayderensis TaxID=265546 RepID=UPI000A272580|nr:glycerol-3-phosphate 1-O-acyltransferase PlsY [Anoxybacillus ayderensis]MED0657913.1 glycerol-3-phosphate 1-O-acyltransferase PlsY [Anoxybacillus ayderensis]OSX54094.1 glycerol-3-phosphate acyltransferase [Anoxybacillus ayderensis]